MPRDGGFLTNADMAKADQQFAEHFIDSSFIGKGIVAPTFPRRWKLIPHLDYRPVIWSISNMHYEWQLDDPTPFRYDDQVWVMTHKESRHRIVISNNYKQAAGMTIKANHGCYCLLINKIQRRAMAEDKRNLYRAFLIWSNHEAEEQRRIARCADYGRSYGSMA